MIKTADRSTEMVERKTPRKFHLENGIHILIGDLHRRKIEFKFVEQCQQMLHTAYFVQLKFGLPFIQVAKLATFMITFHFNLPENHYPELFKLHMCGCEYASILSEI